MKTSLMGQSAGAETARALKRGLTVGGFERFGIQAHSNPGFEGLRQAFAEKFHSTTRVRRSMLRLCTWRQGRPPVGRYSK
jgi:hypothetical protein